MSESNKVASVRFVLLFAVASVVIFLTGGLAQAHSTTTATVEVSFDHAGHMVGSQGMHAQEHKQPCEGHCSDNCPATSCLAGIETQIITASFVPPHRAGIRPF